MAKKATTAKRKRAAGTAAIEEQMTAMEREWLTPERNPLPFQLTQSSVLTPTWDTKDPPLQHYMWTGYLLEIANAALAAGLRLVVPVRRDCIAFATCEISQRLKEPVRIWYTKRHQALVVASKREDGEESRETESDSED